jgi:hypothetical protein
VLCSACAMLTVRQRSSVTSAPMTVASGDICMIRAKAFNAKQKCTVGLVSLVFALSVLS